MIGAVVGVKDEADLIVQCLERLRAIGVGPIVVLDDHSTDGTSQIVDRLAASDGLLTRICLSADLATTLDRSGPVLGPLLNTHHPHWVLFTDADEFWVCADGSLHGVLHEATADALSVDRFNVPLMDPPFLPPTGTEASSFLDVPLIVKRRVLSRREMDEARDQRWVMHAVMPKLVCRIERLGSFDPGSHSARSVDGTRIGSTIATEVIIVHVPLTTRQRFRRKVDNAKSFLDRWREYYPGEAAWHWKRWIDIADAGNLEQEFEREVISPTELDALRRSGVVSTTRDLLRERATRAEGMPHSDAPPEPRLGHSYSAEIKV